jgi:hypothetical protein
VGSPAQVAPVVAERVGMSQYPAGPGTRFGVKDALTPGRPRRVVENDEYAAFLRRAVRAHGRRVATGDVEALAALLDLAAEIDAAASSAVAGLRAAGFSWAEIAARLGISRQAAQQRWGGDIA